MNNFDKDKELIARVFEQVKNSYKALPEAEQGVEELLLRIIALNKIILERIQFFAGQPDEAKIDKSI